MTIHIQRLTMIKQGTQTQGTSIIQKKRMRQHSGTHEAQRASKQDPVFTPNQGTSLISKKKRVRQRSGTRGAQRM